MRVSDDVREKIYFRAVETAFGPMLIAASERGICAMNFDDTPERLRRRFPQANVMPDDGTIGPWVDAALAVMARPGAHDVPLDPRGTAFQLAVWRELRAIPPGETRSYADIAAAIGQPGAVRAVGAANGANPVAVLIPCHRVVRSDGALGGYSGGIERKRQLLAAEGAMPQPVLDL